MVKNFQTAAPTGQSSRITGHKRETVSSFYQKSLYIMLAMTGLAILLLKVIHCSLEVVAKMP